MAKYESVNGQWPATMPKLTAQEAVSAAKRLWRLTMKRPFGKPVITTSSNRRGAAIRYGKLVVNPDAGWRGLVHSLSHRCHRRLNPGHSPHDGRGTHAFIEREMINHVVRSGWLDGKLKREPKAKPPVDARQVKLARVLARTKAWEAKRKRADTALRKLARQRRYYERTISCSPNGSANRQSRFHESTAGRQM